MIDLLVEQVMAAVEEYLQLKSFKDYKKENFPNTQVYPKDYNPKISSDKEGIYITTSPHPDKTSFEELSDGDQLETHSVAVLLTSIQGIENEIENKDAKDFTDYLSYKLVRDWFDFKFNSKSYGSVIKKPDYVGADYRFHGYRLAEQGEAVDDASKDIFSLVFKLEFMFRYDRNRGFLSDEPT